ncbi:MAG: hypothetical protein J1F43_02780 [Muribaculaceae bacterium]|nr:hypothetical protein [Muribaculaceae bacterium]
MRKKHKIYLSLFSFLAGLTNFSCVDDKLVQEDPLGPMQDGDCIAFTMSLPVMTRAGEATTFEKWEDYIDPQKINLLFFYADPNNDDAAHDYTNTLIKEFTGDKLSMIPIEDTEEGTLKNWYVKLPILEGDAELENFAKQLRNHDFKVAAAVNWQEASLGLKEATIVNGKAVEPGDHIKKLHHLENDNKYKEGSIYEFLLDGYPDKMMGRRFNWVENTHKKATFADEENIANGCAERWIRTEWCKSYQDNVAKYGNAWLVWNFEGAKKTTKSGNTYGCATQGYDTDNTKWVTAYGLKDKTYIPAATGIDFQDNAEVWAAKNYDDLHTWIAKDEENGTIESMENAVNSDKDKGNFKFTGTGKLETRTNGRVGINPSPGTFENNVFTFNLIASGTIYVKWGAKDTSKEAQIKLERRNSTSDSQAKKEDSKLTMDPKTKEEFTYSCWDLGVTGNSEFMYLYAKDDNVVIYEIEYIASDYLYGIERSGVVPSKDQGIQMYGIQQYRKLGSYWKEGTLFNLSDFNNLSLTESGYPDYEKIFLLRSVAKVELRLPKTFNAHHIYLRALNRYARMEPMDVATPTNLIWHDNDPNSNKHPNDCEAKVLIGHDPTWKNTLKDYQSELAWYYGSWKDSNGKIGSQGVPENNAYGNTVTVSPINKATGEKDLNWDGYPHILNPRIERSDFAEFNYANESEGIYNRYVLYVPEKFVDDPNNDSKKSEEMCDQIPKVCHIEFRRGEMNGVDPDPFDNVDDDYCYRIYFTENGFYKKPGKDYPTFEKPKIGEVDGKPIYADDYDTWENSYEQDPEILKKHWPIVRNHVYSFVVEDANQALMVCRLEVLPWKEVKQNSYKW